MGSFSLSFFKKILILTSLFAYSSIWASRSIENVEIPDAFKCGQQETKLSGAGLRTATFFKIKIYVLSLFASERIKSGNEQELDQRPICFVMTYLKDFDESDVDRAWDYQFKESADYQYPDLKKHIHELKSFFGAIKNERRQTIELLNDSTKFYENDTFKGEIRSKDFQRSFLSMWFGKNPPTEELKKSLLSGK